MVEIKFHCYRKASTVQGVDKDGVALEIFEIGFQTTTPQGEQLAAEISAASFVIQTTTRELASAFETGHVYPFRFEGEAEPVASYSEKK